MTDLDLLDIWSRKEINPVLRRHTVRRNAPLQHSRVDVRLVLDILCHVQEANIKAGY